VSNVAVDVLLVLAVAAQWICCIGVLVMRTTADKLHYSSAGVTLGPLLILAAVIVREHLSSQSLQTIAAIGFLFLAAPVVVHALARAIRRIDYGGTEALPEEKGA
jgi:monovalent cation/proton antiporter MnhG/PhaG subunit